jgi:CrcB protein
VNIQHVLWVFLGGGLGSVVRMALGWALNKDTLPYGTGLANILGSLLIGVLMGYHIKTHPNAFTQSQIAFLVVGFLGGFTTFSSFMYENLQFLFNEQYVRFIGYGVLSLLLGFLAVLGGYFIGRLF